MLTAVCAPPFGAGRAASRATPGAALRRAVPPPVVVAARFAACSCGALLRGGARLRLFGGPALCLDLRDERGDVALGVGEQRLLLVLRARDLGAGRLERRLVASASAFVFSNSAARRVELFLRDRQVVDEGVVLVGGGRAVLRAARQLGDVADVEHVGRSAVRGADVERGGPAGELALQVVGALRRGVEPGLRCRRSRRSLRRWRAGPGCTARRGRRCARCSRRSSPRAVRRASASARARPVGRGSRRGLGHDGTATAARSSAARTGRRRRPLRVRANMASQAIGRASAAGVSGLRLPAQEAIGQPGLGGGSLRPATWGVVQCWLRATASATFCHSVGLHPWAAVTRVVSCRRWTKAGNRSRPRLSRGSRPDPRTRANGRRRRRGSGGRSPRCSARTRPSARRCRRTWRRCDRSPGGTRAPPVDPAG